MKYIFLELKVTCGEYEFHCPGVHQVDETVTKEEYANRYASNFYPLDEDERLMNRMEVGTLMLVKCS